MTTISFTRLEDGTWGLRFRARIGQPTVPATGTEVLVQKRDGSTERVVVGNIVRRDANRNSAYTTIVRGTRIPRRSPWVWNNTPYAERNPIATHLRPARDTGELEGLEVLA